MRKITLPVILTIIISCNSSRIVQTEQEKKPDLGIAYNIAVKDTAGKSNYEIFTMNLDGSNSRNITNNPDVAWTYRAYKKDLYFISDRDTCYRCFFLYKTDVQGNNLKKVSNLQLEDSWMGTRNDGKEMIVSGRIDKDIRHQLFIINTETGVYTPLANDTAAYFRDPASSPDGKKIAFIYRKNKRDKTLNDEVHIMNSDGTGLMQLTNYPKEKLNQNKNGYKAGSPQWHPTENFITYISMQEGRHNIYAVTPDSGKQWKLTNNNFSEGWHDWSLDGNWLTFDMANADESQYHIMLMNWKTKEIRQLTDTAHKFQLSPVFVQK